MLQTISFHFLISKNMIKNHINPLIRELKSVYFYIHITGFLIIQNEACVTKKSVGLPGSGPRFYSQLIPGHFSTDVVEKS